MPAALFEFESVRVMAEGSVVLEEVSATVVGTGVTVVAGPSGAGKSTLLRLCNRLEVPTSGRVCFRGQDVAGLDPLALRRRVGMVFQRPTLFAGSVRDNLAVARPDLDDRSAAGALDRVGLPGRFLDRGADDLSGGEAQRACLARTLVTEPEVLLMDEPTSSLDPAATRVLEDLTAGLAAGGAPVLWVTHDLAQARRIGDHHLVLVAGRVATPEESNRFLASAGGSPPVAPCTGPAGGL